MSDATNVQVTRDESAWEVVVKAEISADALQKHRASAVKTIQKTAKLDGFRPGKAPEDTIVRVYGESAILRQAAEDAIQHELPEILVANKVVVVDTPRVTTSEPAPDKPLSFEARAALAPDIQLADYKKISKKHQETKEDTSVTDEEHAQALTHLRRERARIDKIESGLEIQQAAEEVKALKDEELPALDDAFVQTLGYPDATAFAEAVRKNIGNEKELRAIEKRRAAILDDLVKESKIKYPKVLLEYELDDMESRFEGDLAQIGQSVDGYLAQNKKTREQLREEWKEAADKRAKVRLILGKISQEEKIEPPAENVDHEIEHAKQHYPQADASALRAHIVHAMRNEATLRFLEGNVEPVGHSGHDHDHE